MADLKIFELAHHFQIESNGQIESRSFAGSYSLAFLSYSTKFSRLLNYWANNLEVLMPWSVVIMATCIGTPFRYALPCLLYVILIVNFFLALFVFCVVLIMCIGRFDAGIQHMQAGRLRFVFGAINSKYGIFISWPKAAWQFRVFVFSQKTWHSQWRSHCFWFRFCSRLKKLPLTCKWNTL